MCFLPLFGLWTQLNQYSTKHLLVNHLDLLPIAILSFHYSTTISSVPHHNLLRRLIADKTLLRLELSDKSLVDLGWLYLYLDIVPNGVIDSLKLRVPSSTVKVS